MTGYRKQMLINDDIQIKGIPKINKLKRSK